MQGSKAYTERIGETRIMNNGLEASIIEYNSSMDITVQFEDGSIREQLSYNSFKKGEIAHPEYPLKGISYPEFFIQQLLQPCGFKKAKQRAVLKTKELDTYNEEYRIAIEYDGENWHQDIERDFKKDTECKEKGIVLWRIREPGCPQYDSNALFVHRTTNDRDVDDILKALNQVLIQINNLYNTTFSVVYNEEVQKKIDDAWGKHHTKRIGENRTMSNGMIATIIAYNGWNDITVQFGDGKIREHMVYDVFKKGHIAHPNEVNGWKSKSRLGETSTMSNGMIATITEYNRATDVTVQFEDGEIREHMAYRDFKKGNIAHPNETFVYYKFVRLGETRAMNNGIKATIIEYNSSMDITVQFEDGSIREHMLYSSFKRGNIAHTKQQSA